MENGKLTVSPDQSLLLKYGSQGVEEDEEEGEESRLNFTLDAIDADINLDNSVRSHPLLNALGGHVSSTGMTNTSQGRNRKPTIDQWNTNTGKPATMSLKKQEETIDKLQKEKFSLQLKVYFLEERLQKLSPEHADQAEHEISELQKELQKLLSELKKYKGQLEEAHAAIEKFQAQKSCELQHGMSEEEEQVYRVAIAEGLSLKAAMQNLSQRTEALEQESKIKDLELEQQRLRLTELDAQTETLEGFKDLSAKYEEQINDLHDQLLGYQQNESRLMEKSRVDEGWEARCRELERELEASHVLRSELEMELSLTKSEKTSSQQDMNHQLEQHRDELSKARIDIAELSHQLEDEQERVRQMQDMQDMHNNDMNALSDRWTVDRQQMREQIADKDIDLEELRKMNEQLEAEVQDLLAWRNEDAVRHDQELADLVGELEDKTLEMIRLQDGYRNASDALQLRDTKIIELEDRVEQLAAVHDEVVAKLKSKNQAGSIPNLYAESVSPHDFQLMNEELALIGAQNRKLESQLRDQRIATEKLSRSQDNNGYREWEEERHQLEREYAERMDDLQDKLNATSKRIDDLTNELKERDEHIRYYEEQLNLASKQSKEVEERYGELNFKLNADLEATTAELMNIREKFEQSRATPRAERSDLLHSRSNEIDRLNVKTRKLDGSVAVLEEEKEQLKIGLRDRAKTIKTLRSRLEELELQVSKKQRADDESGETSKSDLIKRDSLLLIVLQHVESALGGDSRLAGNMLPNPSVNFVYFSDRLISRLKSLSNLFVLFEKKAKELEDKATRQMLRLKKQMDFNFKRIEGFKAIVCTATDRQRKWREMLVKEQTENEELQAKHQLLTRTIADLKARAKSGSGSSEREKDYEARCKHAERQMKLEKTRAMDAEERWNARIRELEKRTEAAEERVKQERQGANEKVAGLLDENRTAHQSIENLQRKNLQLQQLVDIYQGSLTGAETPSRSQYLQNSAMIKSIAEMGLSRMNNQLRNQLDQRIKVVEKEREKTQSTLRELDAVNTHCYNLQQQLGQKEEAIKSILSRIKLLRRRPEVTESIALRQATEDLCRSFEIEDIWD
ncbi:hypothetical protein EDD11_008256 [Mortierella claussenii]|nr:hypothetical protein EDD11_008256 [Mortierella claussenii]